MKLQSIRTFALILLIGVFASGCAHEIACTHDLRNAVAQRSVNVGAGQGASGTVEFYANNDFVIPIFHMTAEGPHLVGAIGLAEKDVYDWDQTWTEVSSRLIVTAPVGTNYFSIDTDGPAVRVNVAEGKTTTVEVKYQIVERADVFAFYTAEAAVGEK